MSATVASLRTPQTSDKSFDPAPAGWSVARCFAVIDLGAHYDAKWEKETRLVRIGFELPKALRTDGKPFAIYKRYTLSHHEKSRLRQDLEAWYGKKFDTAALNKAGGFDLGKLVGRTAFVNITHSDASGTVYANIAAIGPLPENMDCPAQVNDSLVFSLQQFNQDAFDKLSEKTQEFIMESLQYKALFNKAALQTNPTGGGSGFDDMNDDIPF